jgi:hypothetical protein
VYVREAHPANGWRSPANEQAEIRFDQPLVQGERDRVAKQCCRALSVTMPMVVDGMDDRVALQYSGIPDRLYVLDQDGRVVYQSGRGPYGFKPGEMEQSLAMLLLDRPVAPRADAGATGEPRATPVAAVPVPKPTQPPPDEPSSPLAGLTAAGAPSYLWLGILGGLLGLSVLLNVVLLRRH